VYLCSLIIIFLTVANFKELLKNVQEIFYIFHEARLLSKEE